VNHTTPPHRVAWPFTDGSDTYRYSTNVVSARSAIDTPAGRWGDTVTAVDETYETVLAYRRAILDRDPRRCMVAPHLRAAEWDALLFMLDLLATDHPQVMALHRDPGNAFLWGNRRSGTRQRFVLGDDASLPCPPLQFAAREAVEDLFLLEPRAGSLVLEGAASTFAGSWSPIFDLGMTFHDLHGPVPRLHGMGIVERSERFLLDLPPGEIVRRTNWSMHDAGDLDASLENAHHHDPTRRDALIASGEFGELRLRIEVQHLVRLPMSGCLLFLIENQLCPLAAVATVPAWANQLASVLEHLPDDIAAYKNLAPHRPQVVAWLRESAAAPARGR
jgi:dimethylamine monooxygenase subunit A